MSDSDTSTEPLTMSGWTLVSCQGEVIPGDGESESSESSIEIVSVDDGNFFSQHGGCSDQQGIDETVMSEDSSSACLAADQQNTLTGEWIDNNMPSNLPETFTASTFPAVQCELETSQKENLQKIPTVVDDIPEHVMDTFAAEETPLCKFVEACDDHSTKFICNPLEAQDSSVLHDFSGHESTEDVPDVERSETVWSSIVDSACGESSADDQLGACCAELMAECSPDETNVSAVPMNDLHIREITVPAQASFEKSEILRPPVNKDSSLNSGGRRGSDTDSDFICLESDMPDNVDNVVFAAGQEGLEDRVLIPLRMSRASPSISPGFSFMRDEARGNLETVDRDPLEEEEDDEDRDEDTESSTEDSVDDRIESEQSEVGSLHDNNDVGDMSEFADIGDLPLVAGNVARNYIHKPNNHISMILNVIVVLAAILSMGISLGIMMATDLEIEEWQTAYQLQSKKMETLELQLENFKKMEEVEGDQDFRAAFGLIEKTASDFVKCQYFHSELDCLSDFTSKVKMVKSKISEYLKMRSLNQGVPFTQVEATDRLANMKEEVAQIISRDTRVEKGYNHVIQQGCQGDEGSPGKNENSVQMEQREDINDEDGTSIINHEEMKTALKDEPALKKALVVNIDTKQLQQSVTLEQERALHWQQLYLAERRQRERERESEEWEDERDRERWEKEKQHLEQVECFQKLMSANLTTLTQFVTKWNVSIFDDFANLSMLMSTVAELKKSVVHSVHKVIEGAEEVIDKIHEGNKEDAEDGAKWQDSIFEQESLINYFTNSILHDVKQKVDDVFRHEDDIWKSTDEDRSRRVHKRFIKNKVVEDVEEDEKKHVTDSNRNKWSKKIGKLFTRTRKSVKTIGRKIVGVLHKVQRFWHDKKPIISNVAGHLTDQFIRMSSKLTNSLCPLVNLDNFQNNKNFKQESNIHSACVVNLRHQWQQQVLKDPCSVLGKFSRECNTDSTQLELDLKDVSRSFGELLMIKSVKPSRLFKLLRQEDVEIFHGQFNYFLQQWKDSKLLLKTDIVWAVCQAQWWSEAENAFALNNAENLMENQCDHNMIQLYEHFHQEDTSYKMDHSDFHKHDDYLDDHHDKTNEAVDSHTTHIDDVFEVNLTNNAAEQNAIKENSFDILENDENMDNWYSKRAQYRLNIRREREKADHGDAETMESQNLKMRRTKQDKESMDELSGEWVFKKANDRENQRVLHHKSDWLFDRARDRKESFAKNWLDDPLETRGKRYPFHLNDAERQPNWFLEQAKERQKMRYHNHQSDWVFERAEHRAQEQKRLWRGKKWDKHWEKHERHSEHDLNQHSKPKQYHHKQRHDNHIKHKVRHSK